MSPYSHFKELNLGGTFLELDKHGKPTEKRLRICVVTFLWQMACVDGPMNQEEFTEMILEIDRQFQLMDDESAELVQIVEFLERESNHLDEFVTKINFRFDDNQREHLYKLLIEIAEADGVLHKSEIDFAEKLRAKLNL